MIPLLSQSHHCLDPNTFHTEKNNVEVTWLGLETMHIAIELSIILRLSLQDKHL
jgi:hypothetical protein